LLLFIVTSSYIIGYKFQFYNLDENVGLTSVFGFNPVDVVKGVALFISNGYKYYLSIIIV